MARGGNRLRRRGEDGAVSSETPAAAKLCELLKAGRRHWLFQIKANQKNLLEKLELVFSPIVHAPPHLSEEPEKKDGYIVKRDWWAVAWEGQVLELPGMNQAVCVRKRFEPIQATTSPMAEEWYYWATSLGPQQARLAELARWIRGAWQIENGLHYPKDYTLGEDRHVLRKGGAPIVLSLLRSLVLMLLGRVEIAGLAAQSYPQKMAYLAGNVERALNLFNSSAKSVK